MDIKQLKRRSEYDLTKEDLIDFCKENGIELYADWNDPVHIQLHDEHTAWKVERREEADCIGWEEWGLIMESFIKDFEKETKIEVYFLGRSGRHCCIELNKSNILHYDYLKNKALEYEKRFIEAINNYVML